ncbi:MAG: hypothetical protein AMQ22_00065 [Candidatus Methanofastidiosum methylothiophilum]|uniref:Uncharacterized protein n=1 Tax=Candidatus Methanofastidiosum methylothiophilum TaxID=1705564 RepID=A0A150J9J6_9EURY|nr:MAG: hypothetical protein AMQ22_00065 [Candidatus Methanofastidiosum methylthiophilus]
MSDYEYWMFNNIPIEYVIKSTYDPATGNIKLNCYTEGDADNDPRIFLEKWRKLESLEESRTKNLNNQAIIQAVGSPTYLLTNALQRWEAVLSKVTFSENEWSKQRIYFNLEFIVGDVRYLDKYGVKYPIGYGYNNLQYKKYLDSSSSSNILGEELGEVQITEADPIIRVDVYGAGINLPSWVEINGKRKYWHYKQGKPVEKLIFKVDNTQIVTIRSPNYQNGVSNGYYGSNIKAICTFPNENKSILTEPIEGV